MGAFMRADDLRIDELVTFSDGLLSLHGRRVLLHDMRAFAQFRHDLVTSVGQARARRILLRYGQFWGRADAAAMKRIFEWEDVLEWLRACPRLQSLQGQAKAHLRELSLDGDAFHMELAWHGSAEAEEHVAEFGTVEGCACWLLTGYVSGYASFCLDRPVFFVEDKCRAKGDPACLVVGRDDASWGEQLGGIAAEYEVERVEDIDAKIRTLTGQLRRKDRELAVQRRRLRAFQGDGPATLAEVRSRAFRQVLEVAARVARFDSSVLITGESGVGKEVIARYVHEQSPRARRPFVAINCGALPETLLESELFGHKAGAFTGAVRDRAGLFEQAQGGTIFLDEIGDVTLAMQVKLLRVLQEKEVLRIGENTPRGVDLRVIAATNRHLNDEVARGGFREDLYYRLRVIEITIPPLRERTEDILPLARFFTRRLQSRLKLPRLTLDASCLDALQIHPWPGNVRELENAIERAAVLSDDGRITPELLGLVSPATTRAAAAASLKLRDVERAHIEAVLRQADGRRTEAARLLGVSPATLWRKLGRKV
jgi:two-component system, NtrC family, response regulator HydG